MPYHPSFCDFIRAKIGRNWVVARRTANIVRRYGDDVICLSHKAYSALAAEYNQMMREAAIDRIVRDHGMTEASKIALNDAFDSGLTAWADRA